MLFVSWLALPPHPVSTATNNSIKLANGIWVSVGASQKLGEITGNQKILGIAYGENHFLKNCQQKDGVQLLAFSQIDRIWTNQDNISYCAPRDQKYKEVYTFKKLKTDSQCRELIENAFENTELAQPCIQAFKEVDLERWNVFLNCAQGIKEYQLRWRQPNMLTGGDSLETFAGINFETGSCLDASHKEMIGNLLEVVGLR